MALAGLLLLLLFGGFSALRFLSPLPQSLDPTTLKAEAQAIDIQIQLAALSYTQSSSTNESTPAVSSTSIPAQKITSSEIKPEVIEQAQDLGLTVPSSSASSSAMSLDDILDKLAE